MGTRVCQSEDDGQRCLQRKVDGKDLLLECGKLRSGKGSERGDSSDEGLEELGAEQGTIANWKRLARAWIHFDVFLRKLT